MQIIKLLIWPALIGLLVCGSASVAAGQQSDLYGVHPGKPEVSIQNETIELKNGVLRVTWSTTEKKLRGVSFVDSVTGATVPLPEDAFTLIFARGRSVTSSAMRVVEG